MGLILVGCTSIGHRKNPSIALASAESKIVKIRVLKSKSFKPDEAFKKMLLYELGFANYPKAIIYEQIEDTSNILEEQTSSKFFEKAERVFPKTLEKEDFTLDVLVRLEEVKSSWFRLPISIATLFIYPFKRKYTYTARIRLINNKTQKIEFIDLSETLITYTSSLPFLNYPSYTDEPLVNLVKVAYRKFMNQKAL